MWKDEDVDPFDRNTWEDSRLQHIEAAPRTMKFKAFELELKEATTKFLEEDKASYLKKVDN